jgi:hypothetical protein
LNELRSLRALVRNTSTVVVSRLQTTAAPPGHHDRF